MLIRIQWVINKKRFDDVYRFTFLVFGFGLPAGNIISLQQIKYHLLYGDSSWFKKGTAAVFLLKMNYIICPRQLKYEVFEIEG